MDIELYRNFCKAKIAHKLYITIYNYLVDIANAPSETISYPLREYEVCCERHTVDKAKQALRAWKELADDYKNVSEINEIDSKFCLSDEEVKEKISEWNEEFSQSKFDTMTEAVIEISRSRSHYFHEGLFDGFYRCYNDETIDIAKNCLERIQKYIG